MSGNYNHFEAKALLYRVANVTKWHPRNVATGNSLKHHKAEYSNFQRKCSTKYQANSPSGDGHNFYLQQLLFLYILRGRYANASMSIYVSAVGNLSAPSMVRHAVACHSYNLRRACYGGTRTFPNVYLE